MSQKDYSMILRVQTQRYHSWSSDLWWPPPLTYRHAAVFCSPNSESAMVAMIFRARHDKLGKFSTLWHQHNLNHQTNLKHHPTSTTTNIMSQWFPQSSPSPRWHWQEWSLEPVFSCWWSTVKNHRNCLVDHWVYVHYLGYPGITKKIGLDTWDILGLISPSVVFDVRNRCWSCG